MSIRAPVEDLHALERELRERGLRGALAFLNARTAHRFTGVFRFDGDMLRSIALLDKWDAKVERGEDVPLARAYCSIVHDRGEALEVRDSTTDPRFPAMADNGVASYCGVLLRDAQGQPFGALCHYDLLPCQNKVSERPLLEAATPLIYEALAAQV